MSYYLGLDIGGTNLRAAVADDDLTFLSTSKTATPPTPSAVSDELVHLAERVCADSGVGPDRIEAVGVGSAGPFDLGSGAIITSPNVSESNGRIRIVGPLGDFLETDSIVLRNDATCGVIAERHFSDRGGDNLVYLTLSTGVGGGVVVDGNVLFGPDGNAAEIGHMTLDPMARMTCGCGRDGHWEAYCGGANIPEYAVSLGREDSIETSLPLDDDSFTAKDVFESHGTDELATTVVERIGHWNTIGFANTIQAFAPTHVRVGGAVALNNPKTILGPVRENVPDHVMIDVPDIELTDLGEDVVLKGAILSAQE